VKSTLLFVAMLAFSAALSAADLTMVIKTSGQVADVSTSYFTSTAIRTNSPGYHMDVLMDVQKGITYIIDHKARTIRYTKLADLPGLAAFVAAHTPKDKGLAAFNAGMDEIYGDPNVFRVENSGKETVMGRSCDKTKITSGNLVWEYSMDPTVRPPIAAAAMLSMSKAKYANLNTYPKMAKIMGNMMEATAKLPGVAMKTRMSGYNGETVTEVTSLSQAPIPASVFALPAGYAMTDQIAVTEKALVSRH
jgi:hypothetical protein